MKVGIAGSGFAGSAAAYAMLLQGAASEIILLDANAALARAQAEDILHATPFARPRRVRAGSYADLEGAGVVVLAWGVGQKPGETRLQLLQRNLKIFEQVTPEVARHAPGAVLTVSACESGAAHFQDAPFSLPQVLGSGGVITTPRPGLSQKESATLQRSADLPRPTVKSIGY